MKKILFISPRLAQGGAERQIVTIAQLLKRQGYMVEFLCYSYGDFYEDLLKQNEIPVYWLRHNYFWRLVSCTRFIRGGDYDSVISFLPTPNLINNFAAMWKKRWKVITGERSSKEKFFYSNRGKISGWLQKYSDVIVCNSYNAKEMWKRHYPQYESKLTTIYNAVNLPPITNSYIPRNGNRLNICIAATIYGTKNPLGLIDALVLMTPKERMGLHINWYGKKEAEFGKTQIYEECLRRIKDYSLEETLSFYEATHEIANKMNEADCVALFSKLEGLPNAICEGLQIGKPIIMTRVSDYDILVEDGINGFLCDWDDPKGIKNAMLKMKACSLGELRAMGERSRLKAKKLFSESNVVKMWTEVING